MSTAASDRRYAAIRDAWKVLQTVDRVLALDFAFASGFLPRDAGWFMHMGGDCPLGREVLIDGVLWCEGGVHTAGVPWRAEDFSDRQWSEIACYRLAQVGRNAERQDAQRLGPKDEHAVAESDAPKGGKS